MTRGTGAAALPRILDPHAVPVAGTDAHLSAPLADALGEAGLRARLRAAAGLSPEIAGDGRLFDRPKVDAAVLIPLVRRPAGLQVLLTQRSAQLRDHAGQISFPGGRAEAHDADAAETALRETREEIGLQPARVEVIGRLPVYTTITNYVVTPVVALVDPPLDLNLDRTEVDEAFEVPLQFLMSPANHRRHVFVYDGGQRQFLSMPWHDGEREFFIWGATAAMLRNLYRVLAT